MSSLCACDASRCMRERVRVRRTCILSCRTVEDVLDEMRDANTVLHGGPSCHRICTRTRRKRLCSNESVRSRGHTERT